MLSLTERSAVRTASATGLKVTSMVQLDPAAKVLLQLFDCAKADAFLPVMLMLVILNVAFPEFLKVRVCVAAAVPVVVLGKTMADALKTASGAVGEEGDADEADVEGLWLAPEPQPVMRTVWQIKVRQKIIQMTTLKRV